MSVLDLIESRCSVHINSFPPLSLWFRFKYTKKLIVFVILPLSLILTSDAYAIGEGNTTETIIKKSVRSEPQAVEVAAVMQPPTSLINTAEQDKKKRLLEKVIRDIDSFRTAFKYLDNHNDDESRILLLLETDKYIEDYVNPLILDESLIKNKNTFPMVAYLEFMKALMYFEAGSHDKFTKIIDSMRKKFGRKYLGVLVAPFNEDYNSIGEGILLMEKKIRSIKTRVP